jgi:hypothetical protein
MAFKEAETCCNKLYNKKAWNIVVTVCTSILMRAYHNEMFHANESIYSSISVKQ